MASILAEAEEIIEVEPIRLLLPILCNIQASFVPLEETLGVMQVIDMVKRDSGSGFLTGIRAFGD